MFASRNGSVDAIKVLVDHKADVNAKEKLRGTTALMWAAEQVASGSRQGSGRGRSGHFGGYEQRHQGRSRVSGLRRWPRAGIRRKARAAWVQQVGGRGRGARRWPQASVDAPGAGAAPGPGAGAAVEDADAVRGWSWPQPRARRRRGSGRASPR